MLSPTTSALYPTRRRDSRTGNFAHSRICNKSETCYKFRTDLLILLEGEGGGGGGEVKWNEGEKCREEGRGDMNWVERRREVME